MGIKERRDLEKAETKKKIMNAAIEIIEKEGYEKLSIRKIAAKIEYSPTTIYLYYKDKAEIITDMTDKLYGKVMESAVASISQSPALPVDQQLVEILRVFITALCSEPEMAKAVMYSGSNIIFANDNTNGTPSNSGISLLDQLLADGIAQGLFRSNVANTSWMIVSALLGFVMSTIENQLYLLDDFHQSIEAFAQILMGGIRRE